MTVWKDEVWRTGCACQPFPKLPPSSCVKVALLIVIGPVIFIFALLMQAGLLHSYTYLDSREAILGASSRINPLNRSSSAAAIDFLSSSTRSVACLSRTQHMLHRPASQIIPSSPALVSAWTAYEKRHAECFRTLGQNWTETFLSSLDRSEGSHDSADPSGCQLLVYLEGGAGLGNRLIGLVSAFLYALVTNRVLLVDSGSTTGHLANLLCEPFLDSSWILPPEFPFELIGRAPNLGQAIGQNFNNTPVLRLNLDHAQDWGDQRFFCAETRERIKNVAWVAMNSNQYFTPRLFTFPEFWPQLATLFPNASHVFTHLSRYLLLPNNVLWEKIVRIHLSYLSSAEKLVGIQIRRHSVSDTGDYSAAAFERIALCLVAHHLLPNTSVSTDATSFTSDGLLKLMDVQLPSSRRKNKKQQLQQRPGITAVLIASLQEKYAEELKNLYANFPTIDGSLVRVHMVSHEGMEWHSYDQAQKALVEMWLLSLSDYLATSTWSTFGYVAQGLGALRPYIVNLRGELDDSKEDHMHDEAFPNLHCVVGQSPEPCNHFPFWPKTDCGNESHLTPAHEEWFNNNLGHCQDELSGLQLLSRRTT